MSEDLIKRSDAIKAIWGEDINPSEDGAVFEAQSHIDRDIRLIPSEVRPQKVVAQITFDEEKLREIVKKAVERFKEEYEITDRPQGEWIGEADGYYNGELIYDTWYCSNCDYVVDDEEPPTWNFCPNCGAAMREEAKA